MKITHLILYSLFSIIIGCDIHKGNQKEIIISKMYPKKNSSETDTLWVSQNDTTVFKQEEIMSTRPCSNPKLEVRHELIHPKNGAYYFIYNSIGKLVLEGICTEEETFDGITSQSNFYNSRTYYYDWFGNLEGIHYQEDGRNIKTEIFDSKKRLEEILYFDKKSEDKTKVEIYNKGQLKETHIYTGFYNYYVEKAKN